MNLGFGIADFVFARLILKTNQAVSQTKSAIRNPNSEISF